MKACEKSFERYQADTLSKSYYQEINQHPNLTIELTNAICLICLIVFQLTYKFVKRFIFYILLLGIYQIECVLSNTNKIVQARQTNSVTNSQEEPLCCIFASEVLTNSSRIWHSSHHLIQLHSWLEAAELELFMSYCCRELCKPSHWVVVIAWIAIWSPALFQALAIVTIRMQKSWVLSFCNQICPHSSIWCLLQKASHLTMVCNDAASTINKLSNSCFWH